MKDPEAKFGSLTIPFPFSIVVSLALLPLLAVAALLSIPVTHIDRYLMRRREAKFRIELQNAARSLSWLEARQRIRTGGTFIVEYLSTKGPVRNWITFEDIATMSPYPCCFEEHPWFEENGAPFFDWCRHRYTHPQSGEAVLVIWDESESAEVWDQLSKLREQKRCVVVGPHSLNNCSGMPVAA